MKSFRSIAAIMFFAVLFAIPTLAQQPTAGQGGMKVALIESAAFADEKAGITKYITAMKSLQSQFKPRQDELNSSTTQYQNTLKELETLSKQTGAVPVNATNLEQKREQAVNLERDIKRKREDAQAAYEAAYAKAVGPIFNDIGKAMQDYAKQKGYALILDVSKDQSGMIIWADMQAADVTADFVKFYNARPAGTATTATPK